MDSSQYIKQMKARVIYASHIARQQKINGGCAPKNISGTPSATGMAANPIDLVFGERMLTQTEHDSVITQNTCPPVRTIPSVSSVLFEAYNYVMYMSFEGNLVSTGNSTITERGVVWNTTGSPTISDNKEVDPAITVGSYTIIFNAMDPVIIYARAYALNSVGVAYGAELSAEAQICLVAGTLILMYDGTTKTIENITYSDLLCVWNFDKGCFDFAKPLWIKTKEIARQYNLLEFSDGTTLKTINQHRIFNRERGQFTYPMTDDTPIGTHTFNAHGEEVTLISKSIVETTVDYYNVITDWHMNLFANNILTSCRYNNIYPILDMKFVKTIRESVANIADIPEKYYNGLRLSEQIIPIEESIAYIKRLERHVAL